MIVIWRGAGALVIIFGIIAALLGNIVGSVVFNQNDYFSMHSWIQSSTLAFAGLLSWFTGRFLNSRPGRPVTNRQTGETILEKPNHHLMFIKMEYWGPIYLVIGIFVLVAGFVRHSL